MSRRDPHQERGKVHRKALPLKAPTGCSRPSGFPRREGGEASAAYSRNSTVVPTLTILASSVASQLVSRTQPWLCVLPIFDGSGVP